jgi:16S rRNA (guanine527-N7)-methyltransferase
VSKRGQLELDLEADRARALKLTPVSRETLARLDRFVELLLQWQKTTNLIAPSTIPQIWTRHVADSLQLVEIADAALRQTPLIPAQAGIQNKKTSAKDLSPGSPLARGRTGEIREARVWVDFGSGGGFPAIPIACALAERPGAVVHLVESNAKKAAFLREAARITGAPAKIHLMRAENIGDSCGEKVDVVSARALAPLKTLCDQAFPLIARGAVGLFLKGQDVAAELTEAAKYWTLVAETVPSKTSPEGCIVVVRGLTPRERT